MSFVASGYTPPQRPSPFSRPVPEWHPTPVFSAHGARGTAVPGASVPHAAAAAAAARSAHHARVSAALLQRRTRAAAAHCRRRGLGDFFNLNMFQTPAAVSGTAFTAAPASAPSAVSGSSVPAGMMLEPTPLGPVLVKKPQTSTSGGGETYWKNLSNVILSPTQSARQLASLWSSSTPGNAFDKFESLAANSITTQLTPAQYQLIKYQMATNLKKAGASSAEVARQESSLDQYVRANTPGLAGGVDPGNVSDTAPKSSIPWWVWAAGGGTFLVLLLAAKR